MKFPAGLTKSKVRFCADDEELVFQLGAGPCAFELERAHDDLAVRAFVRHQGILYPRPVADWSTEDVIRFFPEAPGMYGLSVQWREPDGSTGVVQRAFQVEANCETSFCPRNIALDERRSLWVPSAWEAELFRGYETSTTALLSQLIRPGWSVYDIGANVGLYTLLFAHLVGDKGRVYGFEANPVCVYFLQTNLDANHIENTEILPVAVSNERQDCKFAINYGNSTLGITEQSQFFAGKVGHEISVHGRSLQELCESFHLRSPDLIKIDVEGAEGAVVAGAREVLAQHQPILLVEVHGMPAAEATFPPLAEWGYTYRHAVSAKEFPDVASLHEWLAGENGPAQILCTPPGKRDLLEP